MTVRVDVASADGQRTGFTEAAVSHSEAAPDDDSNMPAALYDMTKQLMDAMNVQLQYHVQHDLSAWVVYTPAESFQPRRSQRLPPPERHPRARLPRPARRKA